MSRKILIIGPSWLGDMIMAQSLFMELKKQSEDTIIDVLAPAWCFAILDRMPQVNRKIEMPINHGELRLRDRFQLGRVLAKEGYAEAIVLPNSLKSALIPYFAKIPKRTGWLGEMRYFLLNNTKKLNKKLYPRMVERFVALAHDLRQDPIVNPVFPKLQASGDIKAIAATRNLSLDKPILALCPGAAFGDAKCWPVEYYAEVANAMLPTMDVWIFGSKNEQDKAEAINTLTQNKCYNLAGLTSLPEAIDLMSHCRAVISNDSGLMHLGAAIDIPVIAIYGPTPEHFAPPLSNRAVSLYTDISCRPCKQRECPLQHHLCMRDILPSTVINNLEELTYA